MAARAHGDPSPCMAFISLSRISFLLQASSQLLSFRATVVVALKQAGAAGMLEQTQVPWSTGPAGAIHEKELLLNCGASLLVTSTCDAQTSRNFTRVGCADRADSSTRARSRSSMSRSGLSSSVSVAPEIFEVHGALLGAWNV